METTSKQLVLENVSKHFGSLVAVQGVNLVWAMCATMQRNPSAA